MKDAAASKMLSDVVTHYESQLARHGATAQGMDWKDAESQELRFELLCGIGDLDKKLLHEVGAGAGHLVEYLQAHGHAADYSGSDLSQDMVDAARELHPGVAFEQRDWLASPPAPQSYDLVFCSGLFHVKLDHPDEQWWAFVQQMLREMFAASRVGIAFNLMSDQVDYRSPKLFYPERSSTLDFCRCELSRRVVLRHDYPLYEYTVYVYRDGA